MTKMIQFIEVETNQLSTATRNCATRNGTVMQSHLERRAFDMVITDSRREISEAGQAAVSMSERATALLHHFLRVQSTAPAVAATANSNRWFG
jgi:hypothetical protein